MFDEPVAAPATGGQRSTDLTALMYGGSSGQSTTPGLFDTAALAGGASSA
jgi:hypothetical protein